MPVALISVYDKSGLVELGRRLSSRGWSLLSSGGTRSALISAGIQVRDIAEYTGYPEMLGGRVKTLHPAVHAGILARSIEDDLKTLADFGFVPIDLVVVDLYPFEKTLRDIELASLTPEDRNREIIEKIDIGGVTLLRAAGKNRERVAALCDKADYETVLEEIEASGQISAPTRARLAAKAFARTAAYDSAIAAWMESATLSSGEPGAHDLRYGENPHQKARYLPDNPGAGYLSGNVLGGKALSYNNLLDLDAAWRAAARFPDAACVIVKHLSPCGIAQRQEGELARAVEASIASDPVSSFGGVIAVNSVFDESCVAAMGKLFVECIAAPDFSAGALEILRTRKNLRLVRLDPPSDSTERRSVLGGLLVQDLDLGDPEGTSWRCVTQRQPTDREMADLAFAWKACMSVKSNAIVLASGLATVGIGSGQPNRVDAVKIAVERAHDRARGSVMASDAFFPFPDSIDAAAAAGVTAVIQPGGSVRDAESIDAANRAHIAMIATGVRHFRH